MRVPFRDRREAGQVLARRLQHYRNQPDVLVLALPRGGVPVGYELAEYLDVPLDIFLVRKLGVPGHEELAFGAIAAGGVRVLHEGLVKQLGLSRQIIDAVTARERQELSRREEHYRPDFPPLDIAGKVVIVTDDGLATGATMLAAARALRAMSPRRIVLAVPVAAEAACEEFQKEVDEVVCAETPEPFQAVGLWYEDFRQTTDEEVRELMELASDRAGRRPK